MARWFMVGGMTGLLIGALAVGSMGQTPAVPLACDEQVSETYKSLVTDRQIADLPGGMTSQYLASLAAQLRIVTTQYKMQQQSTEQAQAQAAQQNEVVRQLQQHIAQLQNRLREFEASPPPAPPK